MSKLDEILNIQPLDAGTTTYRLIEINDAKRATKDLMLELIGFTNEGRANITGNDLVFELRQKVKEL